MDEVEPSVFKPFSFSLLMICILLSQRRLLRTPSNTTFASLHTRLVNRQPKPSWNTNSTLILNHPLLSILEKCTAMRELRQIQAQMIITGLILDGFAASRVVAFCAMSNSGSLDYCTTILNKLGNTNVFTWNITIRGYLESNDPSEAILLYKQMLNRDARPDKYTFPIVFKACALLYLILLGKGIYGHALQLGLDEDIFAHNALIHLFAVCGELEVARQLFDRSSQRDLVSWNSMINGYVRSDRSLEALEFFREMKARKVKPDEITMIGVVSSCTKLGDLRQGNEIHRYIDDNGINYTVALCNALMDMYVKCGNLVFARQLFDKLPQKTMVSWTTMIAGYAKFGLLESARQLFDEMPEKDVVPWNAMIAGYAQCKRGKEAFALFHEMQAMHIKPNTVTMVSLLSACAQLGALDIGLWIHHYIEKHNIPINVALGTALVDMYAKCGNIRRSSQVFGEIPERNALTWTAMIGGLASHGHGLDAINHFLKMVDLGLKPDDITFIGVLSACCHAGLVDQGCKFFSQMSSKFHLSPKLKHYSCMVDLLGRAGLLDEAEGLIKSMPMKPDAIVWGALFFACKIHSNIVMGEHAAQQLLELDPHDSGIYVLLANMYVDANMLDEATNARKMMRERGIDKIPGCSSIEVNGTVYEFIVRDKSHPQSKEIYACLIELSRQVELARYVANVS